MKFLNRVVTASLLMSICVFLSQAVRAESPINPENELEKKFLKLAKPYLPKSEPITLEYRSESNTFGHLNRPWQTYPRKQFGQIALGSKLILKETTERSQGNVDSTTVFSGDLFFRSEADGPAESSAHDRDEFLRLSCRYSPSMLLQHVVAAVSANSPKIIFVEQDGIFKVSGKHGKEDFEIHFSDHGPPLKKIIWHLYHETWGDQKIELAYTSTNTLAKLVYPVLIVETTFDTTTFKTEILSSEIDELPDVKIPKDYTLTPAVEKEATVIVEKFSENVTFLELHHTESRTTLVEFKDFLMVIDAPISSRNGQLIVDKIEELKLGKPIKYFTFGHHHPHYLGGVRPFVAKGATVLSTKKITPYVKQLASFEHTRQPDALQESEETLLVQSFKDRETISDGDYVVEIYDIGMKSKHTIDYLLFYFPKEKMLLQGDGVFIRPGRPASGRTIAVYDAIQELGLDVIDCIQGWPTHGYGVPTKIKFSELEAAVNYSAEQATFDRLKSLVGSWKRNDEKKLELIEYRMTSRDSVLVEKWNWPNKGSEALTLYHMDGKRLMATHYCPQGNQPRLHLDSNQSDKRVVFKFDSATNLEDRSKSHCVEFWLEQTGEDTLTRSETYTEPDGLDVSEAEYTRVPEKK